MNCTHSMDLQKASQLHPYHALCSWIKGLRIHHRFKTLLWTLADKYGEDGLVFPSVKTLATEINVSRSTIHRWLNELETAGLVTRKHRYRTSDGGQTSSYYVLNCDTPVAAVTHQEHQTNTYVLHARRAEDVIYMELEEDEILQVEYNLLDKSKFTVNPFIGHRNNFRKRNLVMDFNGHPNLIAGNYLVEKLYEIFDLGEYDFSLRTNPKCERVFEWYKTQRKELQKEIIRHGNELQDGQDEVVRRLRLLKLL